MYCKSGELVLLRLRLEQHSTVTDGFYLVLAHKVFSSDRWGRKKHVLWVIGSSQELPYDYLSGQTDDDYSLDSCFVGGRIQIIIADDGHPYIWQGVQWNSYKLFFVRGSFWKGEVRFQDVIKINPETSKVLKPENCRKIFKKTVDW